MTTPAQNAAQRDLLSRMIDEAYHKTAWHGPNLKGAVRTVPVEQAVWRPKPGRHNIAEIVVHCAYWKYAVRRRILGEKRGSFPLKGSNWFALPRRLGKPEWEQYLALLDEQHATLKNAIITAPWARLTKGPGGGPGQPAAHVHGIALHDVYHAGQVRTIKSLYKQTLG